MNVLCDGFTKPHAFHTLFSYNNIWNVIHGNANHFRESIQSHYTHSGPVVASATVTSLPIVVFFHRTECNQSKWILVTFSSSTLWTRLSFRHSNTRPPPQIPQCIIPFTHRAKNFIVCVGTSAAHRCIFVCRPVSQHKQNNQFNICIEEFSFIYVRTDVCIVWLCNLITALPLEPGSI